MSSFEPLYEAIDLLSGKRYCAESPETLKTEVEAGLGEISLPPDYIFHWDTVKCLKWLVEVGYILPVAGPDWFMQLRGQMVSSSSKRQEKEKINELRVVDLSSERRVLIVLENDEGNGVHTEFSLTLDEARF